MRGTIVAVKGAGGILKIAFSDDEGKVTTVMADNAPTVRALRDIIGPEVIGPGHSLNAKEVVGKDLEYGVDDLGLLEYLAP